MNDRSDRTSRGEFRGVGRRDPILLADRGIFLGKIEKVAPEVLAHLRRDVLPIFTQAVEDARSPPETLQPRGPFGAPVEKKREPAWLGWRWEVEESDGPGPSVPDLHADVDQLLSADPPTGDDELPGRVRSAIRKAAREEEVRPRPPRPKPPPPPPQAVQEKIEKWGTRWHLTDHWLLDVGLQTVAAWWRVHEGHDERERQIGHGEPHVKEAERRAVEAKMAGDKAEQGRAEKEVAYHRGLAREAQAHAEEVLGRFWRPSSMTGHLYVHLEPHQLAAALDAAKRMQELEGWKPEARAAHKNYGEAVERARVDSLGMFAPGELPHFMYRGWFPEAEEWTEWKHAARKSLDDYEHLVEALVKRDRKRRGGELKRPPKKRPRATDDRDQHYEWLVRYQVLETKRDAIAAVGRTSIDRALEKASRRIGLTLREER